MLDTSQCQKPRKRMNFPGIRSSKFRHVYGLPAKKDKCYENVRISRNAHDGNYCAVNPSFLAVVVEVGGGGSFVVLPLDRTGRVEHNVWKVLGHQGPVLDVKWNPFNDNVIASASEDCRVRLWQIPRGGLVSDLHKPLVTLTGHRRRVGLIEWHPTAEHILVSAGYDHLVIIWNVASDPGLPVTMIEAHSDTIYSMSFNRNGSLLATTCKDKTLRIIEPRSGRVVHKGPCHQGTKASRVAYIGNTGTLFTTGFSKFSDRQIAIWSEEDLSAPVKIENIDSSSGILNPVYDHDTNMVYVYGKGDGNIRYYEVLTESPWASYLSQVISGEPQKGFGVMPKRGVDSSSCELFRFYKLHATKDVVEPISMIVPRKSNMFQEDIYPDTAAPVPAMTAEEWLDGLNSWPELMSMRPGAIAPIRPKKPSRPAQRNVVRDNNIDESHVISDKNNDRKFHFLSQETQPDYRQINQKIMVGIKNSEDNIQTYPHPHQKTQPKSEKDRKTSLNIGKRNEVNDSTNNNLRNVRTLTNKFDNQVSCSKKISLSENELKQVVNEQTKLISNLQDQLFAKDKKILDLENKLKMLLRNSKLDLSSELNGHSLA